MSLIKPSFQLFRFEVIGEPTLWKAAVACGFLIVGFQLFRFEVIGELGVQKSFESRANLTEFPTIPI